MNELSVNIETLALEINALNELLVSKQVTMLETAVQIGERLNAVKSVLAHGEFLPWLKVNCSVDRRQATKYMKLSENTNQMGTGSHLTINKALKQIRSREIATERAEIAQAGEAVPVDERWNVFQGDIKDWIAPKQYDFIITDPPYPNEFLYLYETLAVRANEWLKPGGLLIAMCGQSYLDEIHILMRGILKYYWTACFLTPGQPTPLRQVNVNTTWKPLLIFSKGKYAGKIFGDVFTSDGNEKNEHKWQQSVSGMLSIISGICLPGQSILDPFCGSGSTGIAALSHGCLFDGIDLEIENVNISKKRIYDTQKI